MTDLKKEGAAAQPVISIDSLAPAAIERKAESIGVTKNALTLSRLIPLALAAGFFIGLGGLYFTLFMSDSSLSFAVQRFAGALMFSLGLALVIICGAELFTGNSLMIGALASRKIPVGGMLRNWIWVWIFNFVGAVILVTLVYLSDTPKLGQMGATMMKIAAARCRLAGGHSSSKAFSATCLCASRSGWDLRLTRSRTRSLLCSFRFLPSWRLGLSTVWPICISFRWATFSLRAASRRPRDSIPR